MKGLCTKYVTGFFFGPKPSVITYLFYLSQNRWPIHSLCLESLITLTILTMIEIPGFSSHKCTLHMHRKFKKEMNEIQQLILEFRGSKTRYLNIRFHFDFPILESSFKSLWLKLISISIIETFLRKRVWIKWYLDMRWYKWNKREIHYMTLDRGAFSRMEHHSYDIF